MASSKEERELWLNQIDLCYAVPISERVTGRIWDSHKLRQPYSSIAMSRGSLVWLFFMDASLWESRGELTDSERHSLHEGDISIVSQQYPPYLTRAYLMRGGDWYLRVCLYRVMTCERKRERRQNDWTLAAIFWSVRDTICLLLATDTHVISDICA